MTEINRPAYETHVKHWSGCKTCPIGEWAYKHCFGNGFLGAPFAFIGEGPGASEDAIGIPFVGPAGRLLQNALGLAGFRPEDWFLTNLVACRPTDFRNGPNRPPTEGEVANCSPRLEGVLRIVRPKHIVAVGKVPASFLLDGVGRFRGLEAKYWKIVHPAWVLRQGGESSDAYKDFIQSLKKIRRAQ